MLQNLQLQPSVPSGCLWSAHILLITVFHVVLPLHRCNAEHIRIRVGTQDGDTSLSTSAVLALSLENKTDADVDYALVWDQPHGNADYDGELVQWIEKICKE